MKHYKYTKEGKEDESHVNEYQSLKVMHAIAKNYRITSYNVRQITRDISHIIAAYELWDRDAALACNHYIITKYPTILIVSAQYGLRPMNKEEMYKRSEQELQHMLYKLCIFLYDNLKQQSVRENFALEFKP